MCRTPPLLCTSEVSEQLLSMLNSPLSILPALHYLSLIQESDFSLSVIKCVLAKMEGFQACADLERSLFTNHQNPILLCTILTETCHRLSQFRLIYREKFQLFSHFFLKLGRNILYQYQDYKHLQAVFLSKEYGNKCLFDLLCSNTERYRSLLSSSVVVSLVQDLWAGGEESRLNFSTLCILTHAFTDLNVFSLHKKREIPLKCAFRLQSWRKAAALRAVVEGLGLICVYALGLAAVVVYVNAIQISQDFSASLAEVQQANSHIEQSNYLIIAYVFISASLVLHLLQRFVYKRLLAEPMNWAVKDWVDVLLLPTTLVIQVFYRMVTIEKETFQMMTDTMESVFAGIFILAGVRMALTCLVFRAVGPLLRMVFIVMKDVFAFVMLYAVCLITCAIVMNILFYTSTSNFGNVALSLRTLIQWSIAGPDLSIFQSRVEAGSFLGVLWVFISSVVLLNLLIAVLSTRYQEVWPQCMADYVSALYLTYTQVRYEFPYGALVLSPAPFSVLTCPLVLLYWLFPKSAKYLDRWFVLIAYQPIFICAVGLFAAYTLMCALVAYISVLVRLIGCRKAGKSAFWLLFGPFYLLYVSGIALFSFSSMLYSEAEEESSSPDVKFALSSIAPFLQSACKGKRSACLVPHSDIASVLAPFPHSCLSNSSLRSFPGIVSALTQGKGRISHDMRALVMGIFEQYRSYSKEDVDLLRMMRFLPIVSQLPSVNIAYTQRALLSTSLAASPPE